MGSNHTVKIPLRARGTTEEIGKRRRSIARNYAKSAHLKNAIHALPDLRKGHKAKPCNKKDGTWREESTSSKYGQSDIAFNAGTLFEKARGARLRGRFRQDSYGEVQTNEEAQAYVHDLDLFVTVQILDDTPAVLSLGKLCEEHGYSNELTSGQKPHVAPVRLPHRCSRTRQEHLQVQQKCEVTIRHQETSAIAPKLKAKIKRDNDEAVRNRLRDLSAWFQEFTKSRRNRSACNRTFFS